MPTPFYHLKVAENLLEHQTLASEIRAFLQRHQALFLLGNIAPDVQAISKQKRAETHFYNIPIQNEDFTPWEKIFRTYPNLLPLTQLDPEQSAFLAGYLCHLQADWLWTRDIFEPVFGPSAAWKTWQERAYLHNVLRVYLDFQTLEDLNGYTRSNLVNAVPPDWLPFVKDAHLVDWRDFLVRQLQPGAKPQTVEVFASRQGISPSAYYELLGCDLELDDKIFARLPRRNLRRFWDALLVENLSLIEALLGKEAL